MPTEIYKLGREMVMLPAQGWLFVAEIAGAAVLAVWRGVAVVILRAIWAVLVAAFRLAQRHVTPARAVAAVALAAAIGLAASQWLDYRSVSVGTGAYTGGVEAVAPAPDVVRDRAGEAHAWVMVPLAIAAIAVVVIAVAGRRALARLLAVIGVAAIVIALAVDAPKGLDEGTAAVAYEGARAQLLEGFWAELATATVLIACGLLLPLYLHPEAVGGARQPRGRSPRAGLRLPSRGDGKILQERLRADESATRRRSPTELSRRARGSSA